tara:strand:+ start:361 stop:528 length:168 start_codon:yes stop_codon:yes gene_type:complete
MVDHKLLLESSRKVDKAYNAWLSVPNSKELRNIYEALCSGLMILDIILGGNVTTL